MKKLTTLTAGILLGFGLMSCEGDKDGATTDDKKAPSKGESAKPDAEAKPDADAKPEADAGAATEATETVSLKVTGMT
ncbi:MAG: hypothetical protein ACI9NQ_002211 [Paracoccaceae bacterium]|jgi:hypothetical protein